MLGKHFNFIKTLVSVLVIAVMLLGSIENAFAFGINGGDDISILSHAVSVASVENDITIGDVIISDSESDTVYVSTVSEDAELYRQDNKPILRNELEKVYGVIRTSTGKKVGLLYKDSEGNDNLSPSYMEALGNPDMVDKTKNKQVELKELANETFSDVSSDDWFATYIPLASYYNVLNGYTDGTFRGNNNITASEVSKVLAVALDGTTTDRTNIELPGVGSQWFSSFYNTVDKIFPYSASSDVNLNYMNKSMTRGEIALALANVLDNGKGELKAYIVKAESGNVGGYFKDLTAENVKVSDKTLPNEQWLMSMNVIPGRFAGAIMYLKDKGIMLGDPEGNCNALSGVTRAECIALVERVAFKGVDYTKGEFKGRGGSVQSRPTETEKEYKYTMDTILNPEADAKYQYTIADLNPSYGYDYVMQGKRELHTEMLGREYSKLIVEEVRNSVKFENGIVSFCVPDIKSDYHEVTVCCSFSYNDDNKEGFVKSVYSSKENGLITVDTKGADYQSELFIKVVGKDGKGSAPAGYTYAVTINLLNGEIEVTEN